MFASGDVDLGAPVLEFSAAVVTSSDTSDTYEPVTISVPDYVQSNIADANEFDSDVDIVIEQNTITNTETIAHEVKIDQLEEKVAQLEANVTQLEANVTQAEDEATLAEAEAELAEAKAELATEEAKLP